MQAPTSEHASLAQRAGQWKVACEFFPLPDQTLEVAATESVTTLGPFWIEGRFEADMMGMPFQGRSTMGFDPISKTWRSTWIDSLNPSLFVFEGKQDGAFIEMHGRGRHPQTQELTDYRTREETLADGSRVFEMWFHDGDAEVKLARYKYTRSEP